MYFVEKGIFKIQFIYSMKESACAYLIIKAALPIFSLFTLLNFVKTRSPSLSN